MAPTQPLRSRVLPRELANLRPWSGWKGSRSDSSEEEDDDDDEQEQEQEQEHKDEGYESKDLSMSESEQHVTETNGAETRLSSKSDETRKVTADERAVVEAAEDAELAMALDIDLEMTVGIREEENDTTVVSSQSETTSPTSASVQSLDWSAHGSTESIVSERERAALAGLRCPLCICPINEVYFPVIQCEDCNRTYHLRCISYDQSPEYHPFHGSTTVPDARLCEGCGCPDGDNFGVYVGYPGIMFHRRDQDPGFREYFRNGRLEEAKWEDLGQ